MSERFHATKTYIFVVLCFLLQNNATFFFLVYTSKIKKKKKNSHTFVFLNGSIKDTRQQNVSVVARLHPRTPMVATGNPLALSFLLLDAPACFFFVLFSRPPPPTHPPPPHLAVCCGSAELQFSHIFMKHFPPPQPVPPPRWRSNSGCC